MPVISVIFPAYNSEKYVGFALDSILSQSFRDIEVVCVNDGSTDQTGKILDTYAEQDCRVRVFHRQNYGISETRNFALSQAKGQWLAFCDSDDTVCDKAYENMLAAAEDVDLVIADFFDITDNRKKTRANLYRYKEKSDAEKVLSVVCLWNKLIRKDFIIEHCVKFENVLLGEDMIFLASLLVYNPRCVMIPTTVYYHWHHNMDSDLSLTHRYGLEYFKAHLYCRNRVLELLGKDIETFIYCQNSEPLMEALLNIENINQKNQAFIMLKDYLLRFDWDHDKDTFFCTFGVNYYEFINLEFNNYFSRLGRVSSLKRALLRVKTRQWSVRDFIKYGVKYVNKNYFLKPNN